MTHFRRRHCFWTNILMSSFGLRVTASWSRQGIKPNALRLLPRSASWVGRLRSSNPLHQEPSVRCLPSHGEGVPSASALEVRPRHSCCQHAGPRSPSTIVDGQAPVSVNAGDAASVGKGILRCRNTQHTQRPGGSAARANARCSKPVAWKRLKRRLLRAVRRPYQPTGKETILIFGDVVMTRGRVGVHLKQRSACRPTLFLSTAFVPRPHGWQLAPA